MNLRTRILLGYGFLIAMLVLIAAGAALGFHRLGHGNDRAMVENLESVRAATEMLEALRRLDSACISLLLGKETAGADLEQEQERFLRELELAGANATTEEGRVVVADVARLFSGYGAAREALLASRPAAPLAAYDLDALPRFEAVTAALIRLLELNHRAMREADASARRFAMKASIVLGIVVAVTLLSFGSLSRLLNRDLLLRLIEMNNAVKDVAGGNLGRRLDPGQEDELGLLARQLNAALDARAEAEGRTEGVLSQQRQLLIGMLERWGERSALVGLDGMLIASTLSEEQTNVVGEHGEVIRDRGRAALKEASSDLQNTTFRIMTESGQGLFFSPLVANRRRAVGWIASFSEPS